eukprot:gb/GFBE01050545.1/.p1 GENE.gb/GFBE01050545.1/~~gb/GFBE01050545.1/.p1  ORF type:complete len:174 (+),score=59.96 gb/GFBE01050545.1/:1-522(+)
MTPTTTSPFSTAGQFGGGAGWDTAAGAESSPRSAQTLSALSQQLSEVQEQFLRQREMLMLALRKGAQMEDKTNSMRDDLIRKDVVIHNLRQELSGQKAEMTQQLQQYEQQAQQLQQQHLQHLQQVRQMQDMQVLMQSQQAQFHQMQVMPAEVDIALAADPTALRTEDLVLPSA